MKTYCQDFPLLLMCRVFQASRSGYYAWLKRKPSARAQQNARLAVAIRAAHSRSRETYGSLRLKPELAADGYRVGFGRIKRIRNALGLRCKQSRKFKATTNSKHNLPVAENRLQENFATSRPNEVRVTDLTSIETGEG